MSRGLAAVLAAVIAGLPQASRPDPERTIRELMTRASIPGMQAAVAVDGRPVWSQAFGLADLEQKVPVTRTTRFRAGSVSKTLTAAALARLVDTRAIDLDAPIKQYVPAVPSGTMTVRQVAGHLSGIRNYRGAEFVSRDRFDSVGAALGVFLADPLLSEPGAKFAYSSYNYTLLSGAIETASGRSYFDYLDAAVLAPLQLRSTVADRADAIVEGRARWYELSKDGITNAPFVNLSNKWAAGGLLTTADDMVRFALGLTGPGYLSDPTRSVLFTPQRTSAGERVDYGIGWRTDPAGSSQVWHGGESMGARAFLWLDTRSRSVVAMTSNLGGAPFDEKTARELLAAVMATSR
jgi:serine beta-lactamase-like protein LACTB, mitochondrial